MQGSDPTMAPMLPAEYVIFWVGVRNLFIGIGAAIVLSNVLVAATIVWAVLKSNR